MAKGKTTLPSCTIKSNGKIVKVGDSVLMRAQNPDQPPYVALVQKIEKDTRNNVKLCVRWYYRPEESENGRQRFHGEKELFLSDHLDTQRLDTIEDKCVVHTFDDYTKLDSVGEEDYFFRFNYFPTATQKFSPNKVIVYCTCEMPYNPDVLMVECEGCNDWYCTCELPYNPDDLMMQCEKCKDWYCICELPYNPDDLMMQCEKCKDWFHPECVKLTTEEARTMKNFVCQNCTNNGRKNPGTSLNDFAPPKKPKTKRQKR